MKHRLWALLVFPLAFGAAEPHASAGKKPPSLAGAKASAQLAPPRPHELFFGVGERAGRSVEGKYSFHLDTSAGEEKSRIVVRQRGVKRPIARIDPNPGR